MSDAPSNQVFSSVLIWIPVFSFAGFLILYGFAGMEGAIPSAVLTGLFTAAALLMGSKRQKKISDRLHFAAAEEFRHKLNDAQSAEQARAAFCDLIGEINRTLIPDWKHQIQESREKTEFAITTLTSRFKGMITQLEKTIQSSTEATGRILSGEIDGRKLSIFEDSKQAFEKQNILIKEEQAAIRRMIKEFRGLANEVSELENAALDLSKIAGKTQMLALNASIEASRTGETGAGFRVVADGIEELSVLSASTSRTLFEKIAIIGKSMRKGLDIAEEATAKNESSSASSRENLGITLERFQKLIDGLASVEATLKTEGNFVKNEISEVIVYFQFSEKISRSLKHVRDSLEQLNLLLAESDRTIQQAELKNWLTIQNLKKTETITS